ncbi:MULTISPECIES: DMT family transporter [Bacillus]|uniref:Transporter n=2 Tax=Bacillus TaxID=1386 RepID=A0A0M5JE25_9BACI|nr:MULTISPECIES: DMT family transporter [Bacillus]ALC80751.1 transporter [Bacillus gobiensis]MBP1079651.1 drug/metabolite transporter (DMT)-like permease [Bacillus capparidis]MED1095052.1 DMT family transporter [Bacillus capparidis]
MIEKRKAYIAATIYSIIIGLSFLFVKVALTAATPLDTLAHRFTIAWIAASVLLLLKKESLKVKIKDVLMIALLAILYPTLFFAFQVFGLVHTSSSEAGIIQAAVPIFTLVFASLLLRETSTLGQKLAISLSVLGVMYIMYMNGAGDKNTSLLGSSLIFLSALTASLYNVFARKLTQRYSLFTITYVMTLFGFIAFNGLALSNHIMNGTVHEFEQPLMNLNFVIGILYLGVLSSLGTSCLTNYALSQLPASQMSVFSNLATLITILAGIVFLHESFHYYHAIGAFIIILGIVGVNFLGSRESRHHTRGVRKK